MSQRWIRTLAVQQSDDRLIVDLSEISPDHLNVGEFDNGRRVGIIREDHEYRAFDLQCPHMGGDLAEGVYLTSKMTLECPWHGYLYSLTDGRVIENPNELSLAKARVPCQHFDPTKKPGYRLRHYPAHVVADKLHVQLGKAR